MANRFLSNININDEYTLPSADGTADQIITTDGAGQLSFVDLNSIDGASSNFVYFDVKNETGSPILKGKGVMAVGTDGNSGHILIDEMVADGSVESKYFLGVLEEDIANGGFSRVISFGQLSQFDTRGQNGETWADGQVLWCDPANNGDFTITEPDGPNVKIAAAFILNSSTNGKIQVRVQANEGIHDLHDTKITSQVDGDVLVWDNTTGVWFNDSTLNVDYTNNRVGIGTTSPTEKLVVNGSINSQFQSGNFAAGNKRFFADGYAGGNLARMGALSGASTDPMELAIYTSASGFSGGAERMRIDSLGNVGIGTTNPGDKLQVEGTVRAKSPAASDWALLGYNNSNTASSGIWFDNGDGELLLRDDSNNLNVRLRSDSSSYLNGGNVGIGTTSPASKLHITDSAPVLKLQSSSNTSSTVSFDNSSGTRRASLSFNETSDYLSLKNESGSGLVGFNPSQGEFTIGSFSQTGVIINNTSLTLKSNYSTALTCNYIGRVGIGTATPGAKLDVLGFVNLGSSHTNYAGATYSVNMGFENYNNGFAAIATGQGTLADASQSFSMGFQSKATGIASLAGGNVNTSTALPSESAGEASLAFGNGVKTNTNASFSQAFGRGTATGGGTTTANQAMAMGFFCTAYADNSFSGGNNSNAFGEASFAFGEGATASKGDGNVALGIGVTTPTSQYGAYGNGQVTVGKYNVHATGIAHNFAVGTGSSDLTRKTDFCVTSAGDVGVGAISPGYKLDVAGDLRVDNGNVGSTSGDEVEHVKIQGARHFLKFKEVRTANDSDWKNTTFKIQTGVDATNHQSIDFVADGSYQEHIDIRTGNQVFNTRFTSSGNVGIGTTSPATKLHVFGTTSSVPAIGAAPSAAQLGGSSYGTLFSTLTSGRGVIQQGRSDGALLTFDLLLNPRGGYVGIGTGTSVPAYNLDVYGTGRFTGDLRCLSLIQTSERDYKKDIRLVGKESSTIPIKEYKYKTGDNDKVRYGVVAEDIESTYPELVETDADGVKGVKYIDLLVRKIAELETEKRTLVNWRHYHGNTSYNTLYDTGMTTAFPYAYGSIPVPYDMYFTSVTLVNNPYSSYNKGPEGDTATFQAYVNGKLAYEVRVRYGPNPYESITADFGQNVRLRRGESLQIRFQSNGIWRYCNSTIILTEI